MSNKVRQYRIEADLTQEELSSIVGVTRPYLSDVENNKCQVGINLALKIAKVFNKPVESIFFDDNVLRAEQNTA